MPAVPGARPAVRRNGPRFGGSEVHADARDLAVALISSYQGVWLLTNTFRDPELMAREGRRPERWID